MVENIFRHEYEIKKTDREKLNHHNSIVVWFTGLSCSGKSTLANELDKYLYSQSIHSYVLDGDNVRKGLNADLNFTIEDRRENLRRIGHVANLFLDAGIVCIAAFITPLLADRALIKEIIGKENVIEVYVNTPIDVCEQRDAKGLYKKARNGEIIDFTGVNAPYEIPENPDLIIDTSKEITSESIEKILKCLSNKIPLLK